jgi:hypothetical protein
MYKCARRRVCGWGWGRGDYSLNGAVDKTDLYYIKLIYMYITSVRGATGVAGKRTRRLQLGLEP